MGFEQLGPGLELVPLSGEKKIQATPTKQDLGTSIKRFFSLFSDEPPYPFCMGVPRRADYWYAINGKMYKINFSVCYRSNDSREKVDAVDKT